MKREAATGGWGRKVGGGVTGGRRGRGCKPGLSRAHLDDLRVERREEHAAGVAEDCRADRQGKRERVDEDDDSVEDGVGSTSLALLTLEESLSPVTLAADGTDGPFVPARVEKEENVDPV